MPCRDDYPDDDLPSSESVENEFLRAALCAVMHVNPNILDRINYKEAGITRKELEEWWIEHLRRDVDRRRQEAKEKREAEQRAVAVAIAKKTMTKEQLKILGIK